MEGFSIMEATRFSLVDDVALVQLGPDLFAPPKRKAKHKQSAMSKKMRRKLRLIEEHGDRCPYCGIDLLRDVQTMISATVDHVKPVYLGGPGDIENERVVCASCNSIKCCFPAANIEEARKLVQMRYGAFRGIRRNMIAKRIVRSFWRRLWARLTGARV
jgi:hypothetical protein